MKSMEYAVQSAAIDRLFSLPESLFRKYEAADLGIRVMNISQIFSIISQTVANSFITSLISLVYIFRMFTYSSELSGIAVFMLIITIGAVVLIGIKQVGYEKDKLMSENKATTEMYQYISAIEKIRASASENRVLYNYLCDYTKARKIDLRKERMTIITASIVQAAELLYSIVFYYIVYIKNIDISVGYFMGFITAFGALTTAMLEASQQFLAVNQVIPMYEMAKPILETLPESNEETIIPREITGNIELNNVTFGYDENEPVIKNITLKLKPGEMVGIVGTSGSGKSTLLRLLLGFEKPQVGKIYYDGQDIDELDKRELRKKMGVVLQEGGLIGGNIYENITISKPGCSAERVQEIIKQVGLEKDISEMPMGLHTAINEQQDVISGGQAQRILIARAILGNPKVIILDEATSALDNVTQSKVMETIEKINSTRIVIAHRLSTVINCDRIIVLDNGKVVEEGNYEELMMKKGFFYRLAIRQIA